ncbi:MAG TPA: hypothetical protein VFS43_20705 [Polyangiaceae bacterium]|nr:hypothetical protein [Polyangiaceae bacterium]
MRAQECALDEFFGLQTLDMQLLQVPRAAGLNAFGLAFGSAAANALSRAVPLCDFGRLGLRLIDVVSPLYELRFLPGDVRLGATVLIAMANDFGEPPARIAVGFSRSGRAPRTWYSRLEAHEADLPNDHVLRTVGVPFAAERWSIVSHWVALPEQSVERYG